MLYGSVGKCLSGASDARTTHQNSDMKAASLARTDVGTVALKTEIRKEIDMSSESSELWMNNFFFF